MYISEMCASQYNIFKYYQQFLDDKHCVPCTELKNMEWN